MLTGAPLLGSPMTTPPPPVICDPLKVLFVIADVPPEGNWKMRSLAAPRKVLPVIVALSCASQTARWKKLAPLVISTLLLASVTEAMPPAGLVTLEDAETGRTRVIDTRSRDFIEELAKTAAARRQKLGDELRGSGIDLIAIDASGSVIDPLLRFFHERQRRLRR